MAGAALTESVFDTLLVEHAKGLDHLGHLLRVELHGGRTRVESALGRGSASSSRCRSRSRAAMAGEQVLDTVQVHPSDWDAGTLDIGSAERDHRSEARQ